MNKRIKVKKIKREIKKLREENARLRNILYCVKKQC